MIVTRAQAQWVLAELKNKYPADLAGPDGPALHEAEHERLPEGHWSIAWEGGPEGWAANFRTESPVVWVEAMNHWCLHLMPSE